MRQVVLERSRQGCALPLWPASRRGPMPTGSCSSPWSRASPAAHEQGDQLRRAVSWSRGGLSAPGATTGARVAAPTGASVWGSADRTGSTHRSPTSAASPPEVRRPGAAGHDGHRRDRLKVRSRRPFAAADHRSSTQALAFFDRYVRLHEPPGRSAGRRRSASGDSGLRRCHLADVVDAPDLLGELAVEPPSGLEVSQPVLRMRSERQP